MDNKKIDLFAVTAHELKTPITTLKLLTQIYIQRYKSGIVQIKLEELQDMDHELDRLTLLINELLDASTMENGKLNLQMQVVNLATLISEILKQMRLVTKGRKIIFNEKTTPGISVVVDPNRLTQVLLNLLTNAAKYSPENSDIKVSTRQYKHKVVVSVQNSGKGLSLEAQSKVFNRYYQADRNSTSGMGLGLYITKEIIERLKGKIWIKSKLDKGSTFSFSLPYTRV